MSTPTMTHLHSPAARQAPPPRTVPAASLMRSAICEASDVVAQMTPSDPAWDRVGPRLTAFVDAARRVVGLAGSPIGPAEQVPPILRLRDLTRLAAVAASPAVIAATTTPQVDSCLRSLQSAAGRGPLG